MGPALFVIVVEPFGFALDEAALRLAILRRWPQAEFVDDRPDDRDRTRLIWRLDPGSQCEFLAGGGASFCVDDADTETAIQLALLLTEFLPTDGGVSISDEIGFPPTYVVPGDSVDLVRRRRRISSLQYLRSLNGEPP